MVFAARIGDVRLNDNFGEKRSLSFGLEIIADVKNEPIHTSLERHGKCYAPISVRRIATDPCPIVCAPIISKRLFLQVDADGSSGKSNARVEDVRADHEELLGGPDAQDSLEFGTL